MWERLLVALADAGLGWAERKLDERARRAAADRAESDRLHQEVQKPVVPPEGPR